MQLTGVLTEKKPTIDKKHAMEVKIQSDQDEFIVQVSERGLKYVRDISLQSEVKVKLNFSASRDKKGRIYNNIFLLKILEV